MLKLKLCCMLKLKLCCIIKIRFLRLFKIFVISIQDANSIFRLSKSQSNHFLTPKDGHVYRSYA